nr:hypothetical protein [Tanacetum cinerariifolium]
MAFISSSNTSSGKGEVHTASVLTASTQVSTASTDVAAASISHDIVWNAEHLEAKTESYMANEEENHALVTDEEVSTEFALMAKSSLSSKNEVYDDSFFSKLCRKNTENLNTKITKLNEELSDSLERDVEVRNNKIENLMNELEQVKKEKEGLDNKLTGFESALKDLDTLLGSQRTDKNKKGLAYNAVPPPFAQVYSPPKKDMSWTRLPEFADGTVTDYSRPTPSIDSSKSNTSDL